MCSSTADHDRLQKINKWSKEKIDKLVEVRIGFDKFRSEKDFSEVHESMQEQYEAMTHKLETDTSLKNVDPARLAVSRGVCSDFWLSRRSSGLCFLPWIDWRIDLKANVVLPYASLGTAAD